MTKKDVTATVKIVAKIQQHKAEIAALEQQLPSTTTIEAVFNFCQKKAEELRYYETHGLTISEYLDGKS